MCFFQSRCEVTEVTVEDPAPGFVKLRDATDVGHCRRLGAFGPMDATAASATADSATAH